MIFYVHFELPTIPVSFLVVCLQTQCCWFCHINIVSSVSAQISPNLRLYAEMYHGTILELRKIQVRSTAQNEGRKSNFKYLYALSWYRNVLVSLRGVIYVCFVNTSYVIFQNTYFLRFHVANLHFFINPYQAYIVVSQLYR